MKTKVTAAPLDHYKETANLLRERASGLKSAAARIEILAIAEEYDRLAEFLESESKEPRDPT